MMIPRNPNVSLLINLFLVCVCLAGLYTQRKLLGALEEVSPQPRDPEAQSRADLHVITVTTNKQLQYLYLSRFSQSLALSRGLLIHWIIVEDGFGPTDDVDILLRSLVAKGVCVTFLQAGEELAASNATTQSPLGGDLYAALFSIGLDHLESLSPRPDSYVHFAGNNLDSFFFFFFFLKNNSYLTFCVIIHSGQQLLFLSAFSAAALRKGPFTISSCLSLASPIHAPKCSRISAVKGRGHCRFY
jgi:hypothetical protein